MLRLASSNAMSVHKMRQLVGIGEHESFNAHHEAALLALAGLSAVQLPNLFPSGARRGVGSVSCYGHQFRVRSMLRGRRPQICVACVRDHAYCESHWDLSLSVVCSRHRCFLQDRCPVCGVCLRWDRPSVEWSHCKHFLGRAPDAQEVPEQLYLAQRVAEDIFHVAAPDFSPLGLSCPGISLDAWFSLLWALGVKEGPLITPRRGALITTPTSLEARGIVIRSVSRLLQCKTLGHGFRDLAGVVAEAPLIGTILNPAGPVDRALALGWYSEIFGEHEMNALVRRHGRVAQLSLF